MKRLTLLTTLAAVLLSTAAYSMTDYQACLLNATATDTKERIKQYNDCNTARQLEVLKAQYLSTAICVRRLMELENIKKDRAKYYCGMSEMEKAFNN